MVQDLWVRRPSNSLEYAGAHFHNNLKRIKQASIAWAHNKHIKDEQSLNECELAIDRMHTNLGMGYLDDQHKDELHAMEKK